MPEKLKPPADLRGALPFPVVADQALELVRRVHARAKLRGGIPGIPTGIAPLDAALGGLQRGLHILAAEPGAGKTALALSIARHAATQYQLPVVYASFDELPERLALKVLAQAGRVSASEMGGGATDPAKLEALIEQHAQALRALSFLVGGLDLSPADLLDHLRDRIAAGSHDTGLLIVDYLQPWAGALASQANVDMRVAVGKAVMALRDIANVIDAAVLLVSAQNRSGQGSANMTSLRESSDLEYSADSIWFLTSDDATMVGGGKYARTLTISKNRFGPSGRTIGLVLDGSTQIMTVR